MIFPSSKLPPDATVNIPEPNPVRPYGVTSLPYVSTSVATGFMIFFTSTAFRKIFDKENRYTLAEWFGIVSLSVGSIGTLPTAVYGLAHSTRLRESVGTLLLWLAVTGISFALCLGGQVLEPSEKSSNITLSLLITGWGGLVTTFASAASYPVVRKERKVGKRIEAAFGWYFFICNLVTAVLYYGSCYSSEGTGKPSWTDNLG